MFTFTTLFIVGLFFLLVAGVGYLYTNPEVLGQISQALTGFQAGIQKAKQQGVTTARGSSEELGKTGEVRDLRAGEFLEFDPDPKSVIRKERAVVGKGVLVALNRSGRDFYPKGDEYTLIELEGKNLLMERPDGWYAFDSSQALQGDAARGFDVYGETFSQKYNQRPRSLSFTWSGEELSILDVGYMKYRHEGGRSHLDDGDMIKYMLAETKDGGVFYLENTKEGTDRVWWGKALGDDMEPYVDKVLRAAA